MEYRAFVGTFRKAVEHGIRARGLLTEAKGNSEHGIWLPWLKENFKGAVHEALRPPGRDTGKVAGLCAFE